MPPATKRICLLLLLLFACGCQPSYEPVWLADSSGFIYPRADGSVVQYDISKQSSRILLDAGGYQPCRVAISPNQDRVAIAVAAWGPDSSAVVVNITRLNDGTLIDSQIQNTGEGSQEFRPTSCYWCPSGKRLLICYATGKSSDALDTMVYDIDTKQFRRLKAEPPPVMLCEWLNVTPVRPDGAGYLTATIADDAVKLGFVEWDGWQHNIELTPELKRVFQPLGDKNIAKADKNAMVIPLARATWEGNVLSFACFGGLVQIDTKKQLASFEKLDKPTADLRRRLAAEKVFDVVAFADTGLQVQYLINDKGDQLVLVDASKNRSRVIWESATLFGSRPLIPAPNGKYVLAQAKVNKQEKILVLGSDGSTLAELDVSKP